MKLAEDLKKAVLQAAMQGKLTKQLETDSSVDELQKKIADEKAKLIVEGKIKKTEKFTGPLTEEEYPFEIPVSWKFLKIPDATIFQEGPGILGKDFRTNGIPLIRIAGMQEKIVHLTGCNYLDPEMVEKKWKHFKLDLGDVVISSSASMDKIAEVDEETVGAIAYTGLIRFKMLGEINKEYNKLNIYGRSDYNKIRTFIEDNSNLSPEEICKALNISLDTFFKAISKIDKLIEENYK